MLMEFRLNDRHPNYIATYDDPVCDAGRIGKYLDRRGRQQHADTFETANRFAVRDRMMHAAGFECVKRGQELELAVLRARKRASARHVQARWTTATFNAGAGDHGVEEERS